MTWQVHIHPHGDTAVGLSHAYSPAHRHSHPDSLFESPSASLSDSRRYEGAPSLSPRLSPRPSPSISSSPAHARSRRARRSPIVDAASRLTRLARVVRQAWRLRCELQLRVTAIVGAALLLAMAVLAAPAAAQPSEEDFKDDFSAMAWTQAFDAMHEAMQRKYAFGEWKRIPWGDLAASVRPQVVAAEQAGDQTAYLMALRRYGAAIPDGHVTLAPASDDAIALNARRAQIGGGFGLTLVALDEGGIVADYVARGGAAWRAGIRPGATIVQWNQQPVRRALAQVDLAWAASPATDEVRELERLRHLVRAPIGAAIPVLFRDRDGGRARQAVLRATDDAYATLERTRLSSRPAAVMDRPISFKILGGRVGYLRIAVLLDRDERTFVTQLDRAMKAFHAAGATGLVIDLRGCPGGRDEWAALVGGYLYAQPRIYEQVAAYDIRTRELVRVPELTVNVEPKPVVFERGVVALIDAGTGSSAEGVAMLVQQRPRGAVVGRFSTNASFGLAGGEIKMPGGSTLRYPMGQSLDARGRVQIDSDARGRGGIAPDVPLAFSARHLAAQQRGQDVELEAALCVLSWK